MIKLEYYFGLVADDVYIDKAGKAMDRANEAIQVMKDFDEFLSETGMNRILRDRYRKIFKRFVEIPPNLPAGASSSNILGNYTIGEIYGKRNPQTYARRVAGRLKAEEVNAEAIGNAASFVNSEMGYTRQENNDYDTFEAAAVAHMVDSLSSKGPFDNGEKDSALLTSLNLLEYGNRDSTPMDDGEKLVYEEFLAMRRLEYEGVIDSQFVCSSYDFASLMASRGLRDSMRGIPFMCPGNSGLTESHLNATKWMFKDIWPSFNIDQIYIDERTKVIQKEYEEASEIVKKFGLLPNTYTVDHFIGDVIKEYLLAGNRLDEMFDLKQSIIIPISRNQGSGFKYKTEDFGKISLTGERKDIKYRLVTPVSAFTNAAFFFFCRDLIDSAPKTEQRIGLSTPAENSRRLSELISNIIDYKYYLDPIDFSFFDQSVMDWELILYCGLYFDLYNDDLVKQAFKLMTKALTQKIIAIPTNVISDHALEGYAHWTARSIKGDAKYSQSQFLTNRPIPQTITEIEFDYRCSLVYVYKGFLTSGALPTNTIGSDISLGTAVARIPYHLGLIDVKSPHFIKATSSGDDILIPLPISYLEEFGLKKVRENISDAFLKCDKVVNPTKQSDILIRGLPIVIYLQEIRSQNEEFTYLGGMKNFLRFITGLDYSERPIDLPPTAQWTIVLSKFDSGVDELNLEYATKFMERYLFEIHNLSRKYRLKPSSSPGARHAASELNDLAYMVFDEKYEIQKSELGGMGILLGFYAQYGKDLYSEFGKWMSEDEKLVAVLAEQLEAKAPHKAAIWSQILSKIGNDEVRQVFNYHGLKDTSTFHSYALDLLENLKTIFYDQITPLELHPLGWRSEERVELEPEVAEDNSYQD